MFKESFRQVRALLRKEYFRQHIASGEAQGMHSAVRQSIFTDRKRDLGSEIAGHDEELVVLGRDHLMVD